VSKVRNDKRQTGVGKPAVALCGPSRRRSKAPRRPFLCVDHHLPCLQRLLTDVRSGLPKGSGSALHEAFRQQMLDAHPTLLSLCCPMKACRLHAGAWLARLGYETDVLASSCAQGPRDGDQLGYVRLRKLRAGAARILGVLDQFPRTGAGHPDSRLRASQRILEPGQISRSRYRHAESNLRASPCNLEIERQNTDSKFRDSSFCLRSCTFPSSPKPHAYPFCCQPRGASRAHEISII